MSDRLKLLIATILELPLESIGDDASPMTLPNWDSVKQMDVMLGVEDEFNVRFDEEEISALTSYASIKDAISSRGVALT